jgi:tetratricopeptide (TPR) repeat protein
VHIDPTLAEGHVSLALISGFVEWNWPAAEKELKTALILNPGLADGHHWYAHLLEAVGRLDDSLSEMKRAHELDPLSPVFDDDLGRDYILRRKYDQALAQQRKLLQLQPGFWRVHYLLGQAYLQKRMLADAVTELEQARILSRSDPIPSAGLAHAYASSGRGTEARRLLKELEDRSRTSYVPPEPIAEIHIALGENDLALQVLERACIDHSPRFAWLAKEDPKFDGLRGDPRFARLLKTMRVAP